ncbi:translation initiation factor IF-2-like [Acinonyx jubatus]|uniref:Translation initiation factor IF-2-like n=1 Tax=Acinonyx jubatus TaxID=32536 RepID=A0ABM3NM37_ACIJB|nr:translation initiation factor IF-2-like [Acinonyx jubatus]XP_053060492.1 translation initiation factor IF-2-like [Acinonyx jubatus]XP_053060493.1 translation initiation factor IF-2-like [Acinonyx jubatus]XP_053060494.1 translation initiation factor IF-2-like [Acinonyx jubatus]XP_053060495.1 translation initiation factor IF-2-like [Acinonyx jubatus]XP_053060496.1 translation initiation factor IF-2-like [Acinonyx jubatus]
MRPGHLPRLPPPAPGKPTNRPGTKAGLPPQSGRQTVLLFFFFLPSTPPPPPPTTLARSLAGLESGRHRGCGGYRRDARAGQAPGRMRGPGRRRPRPPAQPRSSRSPWQRARGGEGPGGVGCGGCYFCRFLFLAATSPWQRCYSPRPLPGSAGARDPGRPRPLVSHSLRCSSPPPTPPHPGGVLLRHPGPSSAPRRPILPLLPAPLRRCPRLGGRVGGRQIDGGRLLKNIVTVSVFITWTRERYLLLLFAELAAPERGRPPGSSPFGGPGEVAGGGGGRRGLARGRPGRTRPPGGPAPRPFPPHPSSQPRPTPAAARVRARAGRDCRGRGLVLKERGNKK